MKKYNKLTVIGAGTSGYMTALHFSKTYPDMQVTWIYPEANTPIGVGETVVPDVVPFLKKFGVDLSTILTEIDGTIKLGVKFEGWRDPNKFFFRPVTSEDNYPEETSAPELEYIMANDKVPEDLLKRYPDLAIHFDVRKLMLHLDSIMKDIPNLKIIRNTVEDIHTVEDDFIIDCTGWSKAFINKKYPDNFVSIGDKLINNAAMVIKLPYTNTATQRTPYTTATAKDYGWMFNVPLRRDTAFGYVHNDKFDVEDEFVAHVESKMGVQVDRSKIRKIKMITGRNKKHILNDGDKKVCAIGLSSFFIEPLNATGLYFVLLGIELLDKYLNNQITEDEYDKIYNQEFDDCMNFVLTHFRFSLRDNEYWNHYKKQETELYKETLIFQESSWAVLMAGLEQRGPRYKLPATSLLKLRKGVSFDQWMANESNYT